MGIFQSRPALRWLAPLSLALLVGGTGVAVTSASADTALPAKSAEQLLVDLQGAEVDGLSGTVVQQANLGLPALPSTGGATSEELMSLLSGNHQLRVWYAGPDKSRIALMDRFGETDVMVNGRDVWTYASDDQAATHRVLPEPPADADRSPAEPPSTDMPKTPQEAAALVLDRIGTTTEVTTDRTVEVAGRPAYELVLTPRDLRSKIGQVRIAVDGATSIPLRVAALGRDGADIATVGYTRITLATPDAETFVFTPPPGTKVTEAPAPELPAAPSKADRAAAQEKAEQAKADTEVVGEGWTSVVVTKVPQDADTGQLDTVLNSLKPARSGSWGGGREFEGTAFSAVLTDDGRLAIGAVAPDLLYAALEK